MITTAIMTIRSMETGTHPTGQGGKGARFPTCRWPTDKRKQEKKNRPRCEEGPPSAMASCALLVYNVKVAIVQMKGVEK